MPTTAGRKSRLSCPASSRGVSRVASQPRLAKGSGTVFRTSGRAFASSTGFAIGAAIAAATGAVIGAATGAAIDAVIGAAIDAVTGAVTAVVIGVAIDGPCEFTRYSATALCHH